MSSTSHFIHQLASEPNNAVHFPWGSVKYHRSTVAAEYRRSPSALPSFVIYLRDSFDVERANEQRDTTRICVHRVVNNVSRDRALLICLSISSFFSVFFSFFLFFFVRSKVLVHPESPLFSALAKRLIRLETRNIERCRHSKMANKRGMTCKCLMDTYGFGLIMRRWKNLSWIISRYEEKYEENL